MCKDTKEINVRLQCLKLAYKNGCKNHLKTLQIARQNTKFVLKTKRRKGNSNMALIKCSECGKEISDKAKFCVNCGAPIEISIETKEALPQSKPSDLNPHKGIETNYYSFDGVRITNTRFIVDNATYPINGITSVRTSIISPNKTGPVFIIILGLLIALLGYSSNILPIGLVFIALGILWLVLLKTWYALRISTSAGETDAVTSKDEDYILRVATALNEAIIHRG